MVSRRHWARWLTLERLVTAVLFLGIFAMAARTPFDTDSWWHLQSGRWIIENQAIPRTDFFSHTRLGESWIDHGWLAQAFIYLVYAGLGYAGMVFLLAGLVTAAFYFAWLQCRDANRWLRAFVLVVAAVASGIIWAVRPQMVSFLLTAVVAFLLHRFKQGQRRIIWWLPVVVLLWVNIHGGFAIAFILMAAYLFGEMGNLLLRWRSPHPGDPTGIRWTGWRTLLLVLGVSILVIPLNPNGVQMWVYPFRTVGIEVLQEFIAEWQSPDFHQLFLHPFIWLLLAALTTFGLAGRRADFTDLTLVALFAYMSLLAVRNIPLFALVTAPVIARNGSLAWARWWGQEGAVRRTAVPSRLQAAANWLILALVVLAALVRTADSVAAAASGEMLVEHNLPAGAVAYLEEAEPPGPLFNNYNWGGYIIWELPQYPVFVDGRTDLYDDEFLRRYLDIYTAGGDWQAELARWDINLVLVERGSPLARELDRLPGWIETYEDETAVVFERDLDG